MFRSLALVTLLIAFPAIASEEGPVWFWFDDCGGRMLRLEVRVHDKVVYRSTFPICHAQRSTTHSKAQATRRLDFEFTAPQAVVWEGYKDYKEIVPAGQRIQGSIWLAGADPDCMILGVWFGCPGNNYMNTLHIAFPDRRAEWSPSAGIVTFTAPVGESIWTPPNKSLQLTARPRRARGS